MRGALAHISGARQAALQRRPPGATPVHPQGRLAQPDGLEVLRDPCLDPELLVDRAGQVDALAGLAVADDDPLRPGREVADPAHELAPVAVAAEAVDALDLQVDRHSEALAAVDEG